MYQALAVHAHVARVTTLGELTAAIAHEINQPLSAAVTCGRACLRWLAHEPPNVEEARSLVEGMIESDIQAGEVISRLRTMMKKSPAPAIEENELQTVLLMGKFGNPQSKGGPHPVSVSMSRPLKVQTSDQS